MNETADLAFTSVARVVSERPARYGKQLASHMGRTITTSWDSATSTGELVLDRDGTAAGRVTLTAEDGALVLTLRAPQDSLDRLERVIGIHLARFGAADALVVSWVRDDGTPGTTQGPLTQEDLKRMRAEREARRAREVEEATEVPRDDRTR